MNYLGLMLSDISTLVSIRKHLVSAGATKLRLLTTVRSTVLMSIILEPLATKLITFENERNELNLGISFSQNALMGG